MGWELRPNGRRYLYRNRRVNGKPVKEYLAADDDFGFVMADDLRRIQKREAKVRRLTREIADQYRKRIDGVLASADVANQPLRDIADFVIFVMSPRTMNSFLPPHVPACGSEAAIFPDCPPRKRCARFGLALPGGCRAKVC